MCGIAAILGTIDASHLAAAKRMNATQRHRGPDGSGSWCSHPPDGPPQPGVALGHTRLSILDLSAAAGQPMRDDATDTTVSFNGEIYNFRELREELISAGHRFGTTGDTEVVLRSWIHWRTDAFRRFRGIFGIAIWDGRSHTLTLARDHVGVKPLYFQRIAGPRPMLVAASELRAVLHAGLSTPRLSSIGLQSYLHNGVVCGPGTILDGVSLLPAGTYAEVSPVDCEVKAIRYWTIPHPIGVGNPTSDSIGAELENAVVNQLVSDVPLGVFLSGGIDSSAIAAIASRRSSSRIKTFCIGFAEQTLDEAPHARAVAEAIGSDHCELRMTGDMMLAQLTEALASLDQPTFDGLNTYIVSKAARNAGVTVALAGTGGDELFGGYASFSRLPSLHRKLARMGGFRRPLAHLCREVSSIVSAVQGGVPSQRGSGKLFDTLQRGDSLFELYQVQYALFTSQMQSRLRGSPSAEGALPDGLPLQLAQELKELIRGRSSLAAVSVLELSLFLGQRLLRDTDAASMAVSLEVRVPLLDHRLIEECFLASDNVRFGTPGTKSTLRQLALAGVPSSIFDRPKAGFELPLATWMRGTLKHLVDDALCDPSLCRAAGLNPATVKLLWEEFLRGNQGIYWSRIWTIFVLLHWCRSHNLSVES